MKRAVRLCNELGATVIVIEHATALRYGKDGQPDPRSAKMEGSQGGKMKLCHMAYKTVPAGNDYTYGVNLEVARSREPDTTPMREKIHVPYTGGNGGIDMFEVSGDEDIFAGDEES